MATFVLLHGASHGGWCWEMTVRELDALGHTAVAPDLPVDDPDARWADHAAVALASIPNGIDEVVIVAHSWSGRLVPLLVDSASVQSVVLLSASIIGGKLPPPYSSDPYPTARAQPRADIHVTDELGRSLLPPERARELLYHDCTKEVAEWAIVRLRPQCDLPPPPESVWRDLPVTYVACSQDRVVDPEWMRAAAADRLGSRPVEIPGGHSPFLARPKELAALFDRLV